MHGSRDVTLMKELKYECEIWARSRDANRTDESLGNYPTSYYVLIMLSLAVFVGNRMRHGEPALAYRVISDLPRSVDCFSVAPSGWQHVTYDSIYLQAA